jgi:ribosomal protein L37AE/L43A
MSFDEIPEDKQQSYPCECGGHIVIKEPGVWECDTCELVATEVDDD